MGDAGSLFLGFLLAVIALKLRTDADHFASIGGGGPARRARGVRHHVGGHLAGRAHKHIFIGGTDHTSHRLRLLGVPPAAVVGLLIAGTAASATLGTLVAHEIVPPWPAAIGAAVAFVLALFVLLRIGTYIGTDESRNAFGRAPDPDEPERYHADLATSPGRPHTRGSNRLGGGTRDRRTRRSGRTTG